MDELLINKGQISLGSNMGKIGLNKHIGLKTKQPSYSSCSRSRGTTVGGERPL